MMKKHRSKKCFATIFDLNSAGLFYKSRWNSDTIKPFVEFAKDYQVFNQISIKANLAKEERVLVFI